MSAPNASLAKARKAFTSYQLLDPEEAGDRRSATGFPGERRISGSNLICVISPLDSLSTFDTWLEAEPGMIEADRTDAPVSFLI